MSDEQPTYTTVDEVFGAAADGIDAGVAGVHWFGHLERGDDVVIDLSGTHESANTAVVRVGGEFFLVAVAKLPVDHPEVLLASHIQGHDLGEGWP